MGWGKKEEEERGEEGTAAYTEAGYVFPVRAPGRDADGTPRLLQHGLLREPCVPAENMLTPGASSLGCCTLSFLCLTNVRRSLPSLFLPIHLPTFPSGVQLPASLLRASTRNSSWPGGLLPVSVLVIPGSSPAHLKDGPDVLYQHPALLPSRPDLFT